MILSVGVARRNISPPKGIYLIGYGDRRWGNRGVHDDLTATAIALDDGLHHSVIVACDLLAINEHTVALIQAQTGSNVIICCSHTHSGPITYAGKRSPRRNRQYINFLVAQVGSAIRDAQLNLQPAGLYWAQGEATIAVNRRERKTDGRIEIGVNPSGPVDRSLSIAQAQTPGGKPIATLLNFQCHGTVLGPRNMLVSADWIAGMREKLEQATSAPVLFLQGAAGDLNPEHEWGQDDYSVAEALGLRVAEQVEQAWARLEPISGDAISFHQEQVWLSLEAEAHEAKPPSTYRSVLARMAHAPRFMVDRALDHRFPWKTHISARQGFWSVPMSFTYLRIGDLAMIALGAEVFTELSMEIKNTSQTRHTLIATLSNGCIGYLPTAEEHALGGFEVDISPFTYRFPGRLKSDSAENVIKAIKVITGESTILPLP